MKPLDTNETRLRITGPAGVREVPLNGSGTTLGRGSECDVVLDHSNVSYRHAKISRDPFDRWIVEDLGSQNGVMVAGQPITAQAVFPCEAFHIRPFVLNIIEHTGDGCSSGHSRLTIDDEVGDAPVAYRRIDEAFSPVMVANFNEFTAALLELSEPAQLYSHACLKLATMFHALAAVVRLPAAPQPIPHSPHIVAFYSGAANEGSNSHGGAVIHLSRRVLEASRSTDTPVKAAGAPLGRANNIGLTIIDEHKPHVVFAVRMSGVGETVEVVYLDIEQSRVSAGMFDFIEAIARQINFAQKNLLFAELKKQQQALHQANEELRKKDRIKDEYVSRVTHDIKGHLTAIQSCLHVVSFDEASLSERQGEFLDRAKKRTTQVADFVKELLELTRMQLNDEFRVAPFLLRGAIQQALKAVTDCARDKSVVLTNAVVGDVGHIVGNEFSMVEMMHNLLFNAVKYTPERGAVHLRVTQCGDQIRMEVSDTGIGIPAEDVPHVFDEFFRAANAKVRERDGSGLGLAIVRQIVHRHGGQISVVSELGKGTTFSVLLPISGPSDTRQHDHGGRSQRS